MGESMLEKTDLVRHADQPNGVQACIPAHRQSHGIGIPARAAAPLRPAGRGSKQAADQNIETMHERRRWSSVCSQDSSILGRARTAWSFPLVVVAGRRSSSLSVPNIAPLFRRPKQTLCPPCASSSFPPPASSILRTFSPSTRHTLRTRRHCARVFSLSLYCPTRPFTACLASS